MDFFHQQFQEHRDHGSTTLYIRSSLNRGLLPALRRIFVVGLLFEVGSGRERELGVASF